MSQLRKLATPFPPHLVRKPPKGKFGNYVPHSSVNERLLSIVGPFSTRIVEVITESDGMVTGCILELACVIDGRSVFIQEVGDVENPAQKNTNGARLKDASSDAIKRCSMRIGLGLHLWSQDDYYLDKQLDKEADPIAVEQAEPPPERVAPRELPSLPPAEPADLPLPTAQEPADTDDTVATVVELLGGTVVEPAPQTIELDTGTAYGEVDDATLLHMKSARALVSIDPVEGKMDDVQGRIQRLCRHMEGAGLWNKGKHEDALHAALSGRGVTRLADLRRVELDDFVKDAWQNAHVALEAEGQ